MTKGRQRSGSLKIRLLQSDATTGDIAVQTTLPANSIHGGPGNEDKTAMELLCCYRDLPQSIYEAFCIQK